MRKFSEAERERIREDLVDTGGELLVTYGPDKTTVKDITDPVGIAKPTFYQFFDAKSDLYVEIFERELDAFVAELEEDLAELEDPRERLEHFFRAYVAFGEENVFIQEIFLRGDYQRVLGELSEEQIGRIERKEMAALVQPVEAIQAESDGPIATMEPQTVLGLMGSSLGLMVLHRDEYEQYSGEFDVSEEGVYAQLREAMITVLARGLTVEG